MVGVELKRGIGQGGRRATAEWNYLFPFRNMLSMKGQRFKAQPLARLGLPYEAPQHLPHSEGGLMKGEGASPIPKESTR